MLTVLFLVIQAVTRSCGAVTDGTKSGDTISSALLMSLAEEVKYALYGQFVPGIVYGDGGSHGTYRLLQEQIDCLVPFYGYVTEGVTKEDGEAASDFRTILLAEAEEGTYLPEDGNLSGEAGLWGSSGNMGQQESSVRADGNSQAEGTGLQETEGSGSMQQQAGETMGETLAELLRAENEAAQQMHQQTQISSFVPHTKQNQVDLEALKDYETLVRQFYTVDANTSAGSDRLNVEKFLEKDMTISRNTEGPQILIFHTHSQEAFADSVPGDTSTSIMGVGAQLAKILTETYGYKVLHHTGQYDVDTRDDAYSKALPGIEQVLKENPSIQVVIDLHRDEMPEGTRLVTELDGRPTARFMFFNGLSRTKKTGNIAYLYNENLADNLAFSFQMQLAAMEYYPGLSRKIYLKGYRYNMHLHPKYLLVELGAQNNTVEEAMNACDPLAHILDVVLSGE